MEKEQQLQHFDLMVSKMREIIASKWDDYAWADRLSNFKTVAAICKISPEQDCLALIGTKVARLWTLFQCDSSPKNESIQDSIIDLANYAMLLSMVVSETRP